MSIIGYIRLIIFKFRWRIHNSENQTNAKSIFPIDSVKVGIRTYGPIDIPVTVLFPCPNHAPFAIYFAVSYNIRGNASLVCKLNVINNPPNL